MTQKLKAFLEEYNRSIGADTDKDSLIETLYEAPEIWRGNYSPNKYWFDCSVVVNIDGIYLMFDGAEVPYGEDSASSEIGWKFNLDSVCEVERVETWQPVIRG